MDGQAITTKSDLERILLDERMEAKALPLSLLKCITNNFSDEQKIGRGGFAVVYKGLLGNRGEVAVKQLKPNDIDEKKFIGEVHCLMKVRHKNILRFLGYCSDTQGEMVKYNGELVMADVRRRLLCFEYVPNGTLDEYIKDASREWEKCYKIIKGVCEGLHYLHKERIVHRDLKPANILLDKDMVPKITDFGISRCFDELQTHDFTSKFVGTLGYLAPELVYHGKITFKSDIHSLGIIITEILTGDKLRPKVVEVQENWSHKLNGSQKVSQLKQIRVCTEVAQTCLEFDPEKRPRAQEIVHTLERTESVEELCTEPGASSHGRRRYRTEAFKSRVVVDSKTTDNMLSMCKQGINKFYDPDIKRIYNSISMEELYRTAYNLVLHRKGGELYSAVETTMTYEVQSLCRPLDAAAAAAAAPADSALLFLQELVRQWVRHRLALTMTRDMVHYMDRTYIHVSGKMPTYELGLRLWRDVMARCDNIRQRLIEAVKRQKGGEDELVPGVNEMLTELGADVKDVPCLCFQDGTGLHVAGP